MPIQGNPLALWVCSSIRRSLAQSLTTIFPFKCKRIYSRFFVQITAGGSQWFQMVKILNKNCCFANFFKQFTAVLLPVIEYSSYKKKVSICCLHEYDRSISRIQYMSGFSRKLVHCGPPLLPPIRTTLPTSSLSESTSYSSFYSTTYKQTIEQN